MFFVQSLVTCSALFWLLHRAWLTLWKPVPELISILGVEVPDTPEVSLAGITKGSITVHLERPNANKPVLKYLIQVNGVNVGELPQRETVVIEVTGLKPGHFYNVRVIALGSNNFQAGSRVIRARTYGRDGHPQLENGAVPSNAVDDEHQSDSGEEEPTLRTHGAAIELVVAEGSQPMVRESSLTHPGQRRNTGGRKHSPSNPITDHSALANIASNYTHESLSQLEEKFEGLQKEMAEIGAQIVKDAEEFKVHSRNLVKERDDNRKVLKEKEEASEKLKREVNHSERANRQTQTRKQQKEKVLREKQNERAKMHTDLERWRNEIEQMKAEREEWQRDKQDLLNDKEKKAEELRDVIRKRQNSLHGLDQEVNLKGKLLLELEEERKKLQGDHEDDESRERDAATKQRDDEWTARELDLRQQLNAQAMHIRQLEGQLHSAQITYNAINTRIANNPIMYHANSSGVDFDPASQGKAKSRRSRHHRKSVRNGTASSPGYATSSDPPFPNTLAFSNSTNVMSPTYFPGPYIDLNDTAMVPLSENMANMSESEIHSLTAGAPLSPGATSLLPSTLFSDDDPPSPRLPSLLPFHGAIGQPSQDNDPQSPSSSSRSASLLSSPRDSSHNLAMYGVASHDYVADQDKKPVRAPGEAFGAIGGPSSSDSTSVQKISSFFFPKSRAKTDSQQSPALGSLKTGQSQSFPRSTDDPDTNSSRHRRVSFSSGWHVLKGISGNDAVEGNAPAPARNSTARRRRPFNMFGSSVDDPANFSDRDPSSPRPVSIASSDLPRPSTDSAPFGWPAAEGSIINRNSPLATNWSHNATTTTTWSRNPSRRPSIQHGSTSLFTSGVASDDDEFLPSDSMLGQTSPAAVGVIGTRPASSQKQVTPRLNPAAPTFKAMFSFSSSKDKDKDRSKGKERSIDSTAFDVAIPPVSSPSESRKSRDTHSVHTQNSVAESTESLDRISSNTPSDANPSGATSKDKESSIARLLRKGSSSKFSLSSRRGEKAGLFGSKKGVNSAANSDRDGSMDLGDDTPFGKSFDSVTSSPMLGGMASGEWNKKDAHPTTPKEGRMSVAWGRLGIKKGKGRESLDVDRSEAETTDTDDKDN
ncbi:Fibronectin type III [Glarea lozoyensis ATCC 20868]|uniref:Fibronectin type III n=1 Tax=Glarea lozoyensis (strain ATCC 20868 / MF5171) TaxID=1116229 RepID=S3CVV2_GLAL2|nr:Fibronectin type III [Glarea lozoyensis ATCC 20868]EPE29755.1 Fibronectin type III [Glarea lozoyensis ATCC 20868]